MFGAIGQVFGKVLGTDKAVDNLMDKDNGLLAKAGGWIGNMNYTDEEKAEMALATRKWGLTQLEALAPFKVVQRILAFAAAFFWILCGLNYMFALWIDALTRKFELIGEKFVLVDPGTNVAPQMLTFLLSDYVVWPVFAVFALYFSGGVLPNLFGKKGT